TSLKTVAAIQNTDGKWVATLDVNTKDWTVGAHNLTATFAGNHELDTSTTNEVTVTVNEVYAVYDEGSKKFYAATADDHTKPTTTEISDKKTINHLYIKGESVPEIFIGDWNGTENTTLKTVTCADTVTKIGNRAFYVCKELTSVAMPKVTSIGDYAFHSCTKLASVEMPSAISIGDRAFYNCKGLKSIVMPNVTSISNNAFYQCANLTSVAMPSATSIGERAFYDCKGLKSIAMPNVTSISEKAFYKCTGLASVTMPKVTAIGQE
ncbi:MAG: leucine-rich repeat domain-containing protein, partial [Clostridia bacterium]